MFRAMPKEEGIARKNVSTRKADFFLQSPLLQALPNINYCEEIIKIIG